MSWFSGYVNPIVNASKTIFEGMVVTFANMLRKPTTIQYPDKTDIPVRDQLPPRYRGFLEVDLRRCTACKLCMNACPIDVIRIDVEKNEEKKRGITVFDIDLSKCMFCGLCVEPCPTGCIHFTPEFEGAVMHVDSLDVRFVEDGGFVPPVKAKEAAEVEPAEIGSIIRSMLKKMQEENSEETGLMDKYLHN